jgi:hypothetical protein
MTDLRDAEQSERQRKMAQLSAEAKKMIEELLTADQAKRLKQLSLQQMGGMALNQPEVAKELNLTDEQQQKLKSIGDEVRKHMTAAREAGGDPQEGFKKMAELRKAAGEQAMKLLTDDQKAKWKELTGEPFKGEFRSGPPGGGRPGGRERP